MNDISKLKKAELPVLLTVFGAASHAITGETLYNKYPSVADSLINDGWLVPRGQFLFTVINGEEKKVIWRPEVGEYQFFSPFLGWQTVPKNRLKRYEVNIAQCLFFLLSLFDVHPASRAKILIDNCLYDLGFTRINGELVKIYLCSRLKNNKVYSLVSSTLKSQPNHYQTIVVTDSNGASPLNISEKITEVSFSSLLKKNEEYCQIDKSALELFINGCRPKLHNKILAFSDDYRLVDWGGNKYKLTKKQSSIIEALHKAGGKSHKDFLQAEANTNTEIHRIMRNRVDGKWVQHPLWDTLIKKLGAGYYCFDENSDYEEAFSNY